MAHCEDQAEKQAGQAEKLPSRTEPQYRAQERTLTKMKKSEENHPKSEDEDDDVKQKSLSIESNIGMCSLPNQLAPNIVSSTVDLVCGKPHKPSCPTGVRNSKFNVITKPQQQVFHSTEAEAPPLQRPARPTNEERVFRDGGAHFRTANQRGEQNGQPAQPEEKRKF